MSQTYKCSRGHEWEDTWGDDISLASGQIVCPVCGDRLPATMPATVAAQVKPVSASSAPTIGHVAPRLVEKVDVPGFEILGELGRGGMGVVYKAKHLKLKRLVALKMVLSGGHASQSSLARFQAEAEAVARLKHPNIIQVYDISEHDGLPYFSMEFVDGGSLHGKMSGNPQPLREAAEMTALLADAMQVAHEAGIVHRDLKPANVLLTKDGQPKITDFGLAKQLDDTSHLSQTGDVMGTPSYMAPEQAAGRVKEIGPAADVWALGAVLFELLTGRPPFKSETPMDTLLQVLYADPVPPSFLRAKMPRDLETICMKCLQKDPARRYASARALAEDVRRWLNGEPILARPVGPIVRTLKWMKRHRTVAISMLLTAVAGLAILGMSGYYNVYLSDLIKQREAARDEAERQKQEAEHQRQHAQDQEKEAIRQKGIAEKNFAKARQAVEEMLSEVGATELENIPLVTEVRQRLLERARKFHEEFLAQKSTDPNVRQQTGQAFRKVGDIYKLQEQFAAAEKAYQDGIALFDLLCTEHPGQPAYVDDQALCFFHLGQMYVKQKNRDRDARRAYDRARALQEQLVRNYPKEPDYRWHLSRTLNDLGLLLFKGNELNEALELYRSALKLQQELESAVPDNLNYREDLAGTHNDLGKLYRALKKPDDAIREYGKAIEQFEKLTTQAPKVARYQQKLAAAYSNRGNVLPEFTASLRDFDNAVKIGDTLCQNFPSIPLYRLSLANTYNNRGALFLLRPQPPQSVQAAREYREAKNRLEALAKQFPEVTDYRAQLGAVLDNLADALSYQPDTAAEARKHLADALACHAEVEKSSPENPDYRRFRCNHFAARARVLLRGGKDAPVDHAAAAAAAAQLPVLFPDQAEDYRHAARLLARCIAAAQKDKDPKAQQSARNYGKQALDLLHRSLAKAPANVSDLKENRAYGPIRDLMPTEFAELVKEAARER